MKNEKPIGSAAPVMPFQVDHSLRVKIATQVTDGIRMAILTGFYKPGDILPTILEFTRGLHVSIRAPQAALRTLKREGLVSPRQRLGTVVIGPTPGVFHGRVVIVETDHSPVFYNSAIADRLGRRLIDAGYLVPRVVTPIVARPDGDFDRERFDVRQFDAAIRQNTALAVVISPRHHLSQLAGERGVPFFAVGTDNGAASGCTGFARIGADRALPDILARLREKGVRRLVQFALHPSDLFDAAALRRVCETVEEVVVRPDNDLEATQENFVREAYNLFSERYRTKADLPDAFLFADDYIARGALLALLSAGIRTGRDVHVITLAIKGLTPFHPDPIDLLLLDPAHDADTVADAILAYLQTGQRPSEIALEATFVAG